jgi:anthranilate synthase component 1
MDFDLAEEKRVIYKNSKAELIGGDYMKQIFRAYKKTVSIVNETAIGLYEGIAQNKIGFLLESYDKNNGRYTFFGIEPEAIITSRGNSLVIKKSDSENVIEGNPIEQLKKYYSGFQVKTDGTELAFTGGLVGSLGYDYIRYIEELPDDNEDEIGIETIQFMLVTSFIVIDHVAETLTGVVLEEDSEEGKQRGTKKAEELIRTAVSNMVTRENNFSHDGVIIYKSDSLKQYSEKVEKIKHYIREGHIFQTVLSQRWTIETKQTGFDLYRELRLLNPSPYLYYFNFKDFEIIGSSPEMLVKQVDNKVYTCPIAGSRRRGKDEKEDQLLKDELLQDEKERAEHVMLVDLARNDMGRIAEFGSVKVTQFMEVQNYSHVMHIVSLVEGKKKGEYHPLDLVSSFLPAGTLSGAPKIRAMEIIDELEVVRRGLYGGATGYVDFNGNMDFCITIRTMVKKNDRVYLQAGAGIVADSVPKSEYEECCNKVMALAKTLVEEEKL